jgi:formylglycine-generating enzyme required for sulfatase activity
VETFWIDRYEVTNARYGRFIDDGGYYTRQHWTNEGWQWLQSKGITTPPYWGRPDFGLPQHPVVSVTWHEAYAYCLWAGKRLPTEIEWEKAARGDDGRLYPWGNEWDCANGNFDDETIATPATNECAGNDGFNLTAPVGSYAAGQSPYHVHDMAGNVWEWTLSQPGPYPYNANDGRNLPESDGPRVIRGASWLTYTGDLGGDNHARVTFRAELLPTTQNDRTGFRCVARPNN